MGFFDRFKPQPRWKHIDPQVRSAAVDTLPDDEQDLIAQIAREDEHAGVRRAAVAKLTDAGTIAGIAAADPDESVKAVARDLLLALAQDSGEVADARAALGGLSHEKDLNVVARSAELEPIALEALGRLADSRLIGSVARQATHAAVRRSALERLTDEADIVAVATKTEHRDVGLAALDRLGPSRELLNTIATRARSKVVQRRARAALHALEEAAAPAVTPPPAVHRRLQLCEIAEGLARETDLHRAEQHLAAVEGEWQVLAGEAAPEVAERFQAAVADVRTLLSRSADERAAHEAAMRALAADAEQAAAGRIALCERVEALATSGAADANLDEVRTLWVALPAWPESMRESSDVRQLDDRFSRACNDIARRAARQAEGAALEERLAPLAGEATRIAALEPLADARRAWTGLAAKWRDAGGASASDTLSAAWRAAEEQLSARDRKQREQRSQDAQRNVARLDRLLATANALIAHADLSLKDGDRTLRDLRQALESPGAFPVPKDEDGWVEKLRAAHTALLPRVQELRDAEDWRRWANATVQEDLCKEAEALGAVSDPTELAKRVRDLQQRWKQVGAAPKDKSEALWLRFKAACDAVRPQVDAHFATLRKTEGENLERKLALVTRAEALAESSDWITTGEELKKLQAEWQHTGQAGREHSQELWNRFRTACDRFFTRRKEDLAQRKSVWHENAEKKEALVARAEALSQSTDWTQASAELKRLQAEWKTVGPVKKQKSEVLWTRFRAACDQFFERYKHRDQHELQSHVASRESAVVGLEALLAPPAEGAEPLAPEQLRNQVLHLWQQWHDGPRVPRQLIEPIEQRLDTALMAIVEQNPEVFKGSRLDIAANRERMEKLVTQVEGFLSGPVQTHELAASPSTTLAAMLKDALAANTIGGRVDEDAKKRAAIAAVKEAQAAWRRLGPVPGPDGHALAGRFFRASKRFFEVFGTGEDDERDAGHRGGAPWARGDRERGGDRERAERGDRRGPRRPAAEAGRRG